MLECCYDFVYQLLPREFKPEEEPFWSEQIRLHAEELNRNLNRDKDKEQKR